MEDKKNKGLENKIRVKTELIIRHNNKNLNFIYPAFGPNTYVNVGAEIEQAKLKRPTMAEIASLVYSAFNSDDEYSDEIKDIIKEGLWAFTGTLCTPKGAYVQDDPKIRNIHFMNQSKRPFMDESDLVKKLEANDPSVRFVPFSFKTGEMNPLELGKNPYIIALAGKEGAEKLAEVANKYKKDPDLISLKTDEMLYVDKHITTRVSALNAGLDFGCRRLYVCGSHLGDGNYHSFGIKDLM